MPAKYTEYILTLAMGLVILTSITIAFQGMYENVEEEVIRRELEGMTQKIAQTVIEVYLLGQEAGSAVDWVIEVQIELPSDIGGYFFEITIIDSNEDQRPDSIYGSLHTKNEISVLVDLRPIADQIQIRGSFWSVNKTHMLRYHPKEATLDLMDLTKVGL